MNKLIEDYFKKQLLRDEEIISIEPFIHDNEQQWRVTYVNICCISGADFEEITISELLSFMYGV